MATTETKPAKKPSVFIVKTNGSKDRLIRAANAGAVRQHLLGEVTISKASGDEVADAITEGVTVENAVESAPDTGATGTAAATV